MLQAKIIAETLFRIEDTKFSLNPFAHAEVCVKQIALFTIFSRADIC